MCRTVLREPGGNFELMLRKPRTAKPPIKASQVGVATSAGGFGSSSHQPQLFRADLAISFPLDTFSYPEWTLFGSSLPAKGVTGWCKSAK